MSFKLNIVNPLEIDNWDELLLTNEKAFFVRMPAWAMVLSESTTTNLHIFSKLITGLEV
jgi:hypothetical protein